jgi:chloramphenicol-sensitive protein RarD
MPPRSGLGRGVLYGLAAYGLWGLAPLYWPLLAPATALETLAHRMTWSLIFLALLNAIRKNWSVIRQLLGNARVMKLLTIAAVLITINWGLYIWSVINGHVIDASLGYFINPLINVAFGVLIFKEKLRPLQWIAVAVAASGVLFLTLDAQAWPWIGLTLGVTFSAYGMVKKIANVDGVESLTIETLILLPFSIAYLGFLGVAGTIAFGNNGWGHAVLAVLAGLVTAVPLLAFGAAAVRIPYSLMGILQYCSPTIQFLLGFFFYEEVMTSGRWTGFAIVWLALVIFSADAFRSRKNYVVTD